MLCKRDSTSFDGVTCDSSVFVHFCVCKLDSVYTSGRVFLFIYSLFFKQLHFFHVISCKQQGILAQIPLYITFSKLVIFHCQFLLSNGSFTLAKSLIVGITIVIENHRSM